MYHDRSGNLQIISTHAQAQRYIKGIVFLDEMKIIGMLVSLRSSWQTAIPS